MLRCVVVLFCGVAFVCVVFELFRVGLYCFFCVCCWLDVCRVGMVFVLLVWCALCCFVLVRVVMV